MHPTLAGSLADMRKQIFHLPNITVKYSYTQIMRRTEMNGKTKRRLIKSFNHVFLKRIASLVCLSLIVFSFAYPLVASDETIHATSVSALAASDSLVQSSTELIWERTYGGKGDDRAFYAAPTKDGGFLIVGSTTSFSEVEPMAWIVRVDSEGNMLWNKTFPEINGSEFRHVLKTEDGFLLVGNTFASSGDSDGMIIRIDEEGSVLWNITTGSPTVDRLLFVTETADGFVAVGLTFPSNTSGSDAWVIKTNPDGEVIWNKTYGQLGDNAARAIVPAENGSCVVAGYTNSTEEGKYQFWLFKIDKQGALLWNRTYGVSESQKAIALAKAENGYLITGDSHPAGGDADALMVKTDLEGNLMWNKTFGGDDFDMPNDVIRLNSGGYAIAGFTFSFGKGERDLWLFKIDDTGNVVWSCTQGREGFEEGYYLDEVAGSEFVMVGWTNSIGSGLYDYYVVKIKVEARNDSFFANGLFYALVGASIVGGLSLAFLSAYFRRKRREDKADGESKQPRTDLSV
jgi:hypothetical protein